MAVERCCCGHIYFLNWLATAPLQHMPIIGVNKKGVSMTKKYWQTRKNWYLEMASHIKEQRDHAARGDERQKLVNELERIYTEISFIDEKCLPSVT